MSARSLGVAALAAAALIALAGCGKMGLLEQPRPLWGEKARAAYQARRSGKTPVLTRRQQGLPPREATELAPPQPGAATPVPVPPASPSERPMDAPEPETGPT